ncbi:polar amino acid ABC transporter inner membrane subunit [Caballeronia fortuita]|uniref:Polar amino acid ABC transporter inner membrane subunit n=1 Tax=Caballeronia fortuita TaxID=1777138 RepID=A0A157ZTY9_9BURK|nr:amino acid ABC transporter permease/ATP-binding protein [Caballeronia fortuita]SAK49008.1 polar amino acid ABC transporter inner membrane subunit [Caballeronia fortuita]
MQNFLHYLTFPYLLQGCITALGLLFGALAGGLLIGFVLALAADSRWLWLRYPVRAYIYVIRGTPQLLQLILLFNVLPQAGITLAPFVSALLALTINETAFCAEIIRGGIRSVNRDQRIAAQAFGFSALTELGHVVVPQGLRAIIPALGNEAVGLLKSTSLASVVGVSELTLRSQTIVSQNFEFLPVLLASGVMYIALSALIAAIQNWCERNVGTGRRARRGAQPELRIDDPGPVGRMAPVESASDAHVPQLEIDKVRVSYGSKQVLKDVSLSVAPGEVVALLGKSGSGKSTLLKTILALNPLDSGSIRIEGRSLTSTGSGAPMPRRRLAKARADARIGMVFQNFALFDHLSALDNAASIPVRVQHVPRVEAARRARIALLKVGLKDFADHMPHELSGGQQQRVGIARALASDPRVILFDEPTSALDPELVGEVDETIRRLARTGITMLLSTHDIDFAASVADRIVFLHDGRIIEQGTPDILRAPKTPEFAAFLRHPEDDGDAPLLKPAMLEAAR